ncbi:MAG: hypothetical protein LBJ12_02835 [Oscillospiraceae bacterium]|nr:hypothetical protein [Oscillospiraceae bacterium]
MSLILVIGALAAAAGVFAVPVSAAVSSTIAFKKKLSNGTNIAYYFDPSLGNTALGSLDIRPRIIAARERIMYPPGLSNPIILWRTTTWLDSKMDFKQYAGNQTTATVGVTQWFKRIAPGNTQSSFGVMMKSELDQQDWLYGTIAFGNAQMKRYNANKQELIIIHEMMHVYGGKDITAASSILNAAEIESGVVTKLTSDANSILVDKY